MPVVVQPEEFTMVLFEAPVIHDLVERLAGQVGLPADLEITVAVDESTPLGNARVASVDPVTLTLESGALEDARAPRKLDEVGSTDVLGRLLFEVKDRLDPAFADAPAFEDLGLAHISAWQTYCVGRLGRLGHKVQRQRRLYQFRNRHGFTDVADAAFDELWTSDGLSWADIESISDAALAARG